MKKFLGLLAVVTMCAGIASAQWNVGASFGYESESKKNTVAGEDVNEDLVSNFSISPEVSYSLNEKMDLGLGLTYKSISSRQYDEYGDEKRNNYTSYAVSPFVKYYVASLGNFKLSFKGSLAYANKDNKDTDVKTDAFGMSVVPVVDYKLCDSISLFAQLNFASLNYVYEKQDNDTDTKTEHFKIGADSDNVINTSNFQIGFSYHF